MKLIQSILATAIAGAVSVWHVQAVPHAVCVLEATSNAIRPLSGTFEFTLSDVANAESNVQIDFNITGM